jgi:2,4-dienoyl-CoA reductase-like NADH-dependent reductase (Old Yellow Enzyme family)
MLNEISTARPQPLFTPVQMGELELPNRIIMAPLTRMRAANPGRVPSELHVEYYAQRASAGLIIADRNMGHGDESRTRKSLRGCARFTR